jgi:hypothetical protein
MIGRKTPANEPGPKTVRVARREALPHLRKEMRILNDHGSAPWRAIPSHPEGERLREDGPARGLDKEYGRRSFGLPAVAFGEGGLFDN